MNDKILDEISKQFWATNPDPYESQKTMNDNLLIALKQARLEALRECRNKLSILTGAYTHVIDGFVSIEQMEAIIDNLITQTENENR